VICTERLDQNQVFWFFNVWLPPTLGYGIAALGIIASQRFLSLIKSSCISIIVSITVSSLVEGIVENSSLVR
jgi:hypothetical protein